MDRIYDKNRKIYQYKVKWLNYPTFEASFTDEQDSFREHIEEYDAKFPRGSCRLDADYDKREYARSLPDGVLGLRKAPAVRFDLPQGTDATTTARTTTSPKTTRFGRSTTRPRRLQFYMNAGEHDMLRRLRCDDPELYELKLFEWDYMASLGDDTGEPDLDIEDGPEVMFTLGVTDDAPATATAPATASQLRGGAHHQPCTSGTTSTHGQAGMPAGNYKIYSGHGNTGLPGGTAGTHPGYMSTGGYQYNLVQTREASRSLDYIDSSYLGTPRASASRSPGQLQAPGHQGIPVASLESRIWNYSTRIQSSRDSGTS